MMTHEKVLKRDDGRRVKIFVHLHTWSTEAPWYWDCLVCEPGKRTWTSVVDRSDMSLRSLDYKRRRIEERRRKLEFVTSNEVLETMHELLTKIAKPKV